MNYAILLAGGTGRRIQSTKMPKQFVLEQLPNIDFANHPEILDEYLPWSEQLPDECRLTTRSEKQLKK